MEKVIKYTQNDFEKSKCKDCDWLRDCGDKKRNCMIPGKRRIKRK